MSKTTMWQVQLLLWIVMLAACTGPAEIHSSTVTATTIPATPTATASSTPTATPTATASLTPTATASSTPTVVEPSATPTPLPTATLTAEEWQQRWQMVDANVAAMMSTNGRCDLPCWWGINPGDTVAQAWQIFDTVDEYAWVESPGQRGELQEIGYFRHRYRDKMGEMIHAGIFVHLLVKDDQVAVFDIYASRSVDFAMGTAEYNQIGERLTRDWQQFSIRTMLETYGEPDMIYIMPRTPGYIINIYYLELGIAVSYHPEVNTNEQGETTICRSMLDIFNLRYLNLFLYDPLAGLPPGYVHATYALLPLDPTEGVQVLELSRVEAVTGMNLEAFVAFVLENEGEDACFPIH